MEKQRCKNCGTLISVHTNFIKGGRCFACYAAWEKDIESFVLYFNDYVEAYIHEDEDCIKDAFMDETNYNNGDVLSGQYIMDESELELKFEECVEWLKTHSDRCSECANLIMDEDVIIGSQYHPYGDGYASEDYSTGYVCSQCGNEERW